MDSTATFAQLQLGFVDQIQWRYEVICPLVLFGDRTAPQRAQETHTHPETVRQLRRRFRQQGMLGLLNDRRLPPIPIEVLGAAKGRMYTQEELARCFSHALFPRMTNQYGCVTLHSYHCYVKEGLPQTQVLLWVYGGQLRAVFEHVVLAEYHCRYEWRDRTVKDIRAGGFYPTRFASPQGTLIPLTPEDSVVVYHAKPPRRQAPARPPAPQLWLFEVVHAG